MLEWLIVFNIFFYKESTLIKKRGMIIIVKVNYFNQLVRLVLLLFFFNIKFQNEAKK